MKKKILTELRIFPTRERLRSDFDKMVERTQNYERKIIADREIYISNRLRIIFTLDDEFRVRGLRPDKVFIDEMVNEKTKDYLNQIK